MKPLAANPGHTTPTVREARGGSSPLIRTLTTAKLTLAVAAALSAAVCLSGDGLGAHGLGPTTEVVVTMKAPPLSQFGRSLQSVSHTTYLRSLQAAQNVLARRVQSAVPTADVRWRYHLVLDGFAVVLPRSELGALAKVPGIEKVWPNVRYHALRATAGGGPGQIGADRLWGPAFASAGTGMRIAIIDDGLDAAHPYFDPNGFTYPAGFPKGQTAFTTPKVIVQRTFAPPGSTYKYANTPFDPTQSFHATHVAGIAAGNYGTNAAGTLISGVAPNAQLGNYKALTVPTPGFGLDGNSAEIAAAIEAAVADGMNVINLSLGEPEVEPSRDLVVQAIDGAAAAGVVPVVAAGNDFDTFGYGSVSSPGNAPDAITVAAVTSADTIADFSSAGPTPVSLAMKPDISGPGVNVLSSLPPSQGTWGLLSGTSMATPAIAGATAVLKSRHLDWTVAQLKSALVQTGDPVHSASGSEVVSMREGGGLANLVRADVPLIFAAPTGVSFGRLAPGQSSTQSVTLTDAGGGAGEWTATIETQTGSAAVAVAPTVAVPGTVAVNATGGATAGDTAGFVILTRGADVRRIPFWLQVSIPKLATERRPLLTRPGLYHATTKGGPSLISSYRYPTGGDVSYPGPERAFRVVVSGAPANIGVVVLSGKAIPHVTFDGAEDHLAGYTALPVDVNPYRAAWNTPVPVAGVVLPKVGAYDLVFDTRSAADAGPFRFRYWVNDVTPPRIRITVAARTIVMRLTDAGSGVDPSSVALAIDGRTIKTKPSDGVIRIRVARGRHTVAVKASDYQETKNMEDVARILPNTATLRTTVRVP